jgi:hypothetical protein
MIDYVVFNDAGWCNIDSKFWDATSLNPAHLFDNSVTIYFLGMRIGSLYYVLLALSARTVCSVLSEEDGSWVRRALLWHNTRVCVDVLHDQMSIYSLELLFPMLWKLNAIKTGPSRSRLHRRKSFTISRQQGMNSNLSIKKGSSTGATTLNNILCIPFACLGLLHLTTQSRSTR